MLNSIHLEIILYHTYQLLHCKTHIQITTNHSNVNEEIKK